MLAVVQEGRAADDVVQEQVPELGRPRGREEAARDVQREVREGLVGRGEDGEGPAGDREEGHEVGRVDRQRCGVEKERVRKRE